MAQLVRSITPLFDRVLVKRILPASETAGGILLPESARDKLPRAEVFAVGTGRVSNEGKSIPLSLKVGDTVLIPDNIFSSTEIKVDNTSYLLIREEDVLAKIQKP